MIKMNEFPKGSAKRPPYNDGKLQKFGKQVGKIRESAIGLRQESSTGKVQNIKPMFHVLVIS